MAKRIQCIGYNRQPCPAWWYHEGPGRPHRYCPRCLERRRWLEERLERCSVCGKLLLHPKTGRPKKTCSKKCANRRAEDLSRIRMRRFA